MYMKRFVGECSWEPYWSEGEGECDMTTTGVSTELMGCPGAGCPCRVVLPWGKGPGLCTLQGLVTAFGLSWGREQLWVPFEAIPGGGIYLWAIQRQLSWQLGDKDLHPGRGMSLKKYFRRRLGSILRECGLFWILEHERTGRKRLKRGSLDTETRW